MVRAAPFVKDIRTCPVPGAVYTSCLAAGVTGLAQAAQKSVAIRNTDAAIRPYISCFVKIFFMFSP